MDVDSIAISQAIRDLGLIGVLVLILVAGFRGWWVWGTAHRDKVTALENAHTKHLEDLAGERARERAGLTEQLDHERDAVRYWRDAALRGLNVAEAAAAREPPDGP